MMIDKEDVRIPQIKEELSKCSPLEVGSEVTALLQLHLNDWVPRSDMGLLGL